MHQHASASEAIIMHSAKARARCSAGKEKQSSNKFNLHRDPRCSRVLRSLCDQNIPKNLKLVPRNFLVLIPVNVTHAGPQ